MPKTRKAAKRKMAKAKAKAWSEGHMRGMADQAGNRTAYGHTVRDKGPSGQRVMGGGEITFYEGDWNRDLSKPGRTGSGMKAKRKAKAESDLKKAKRQVRKAKRKVKRNS